MSAIDEQVIIRYLLGDLGATETTSVEKRIFTEPDFLETLRATEEQLIRDELAGDLLPEQLSKFREHFLSFPDLRERYDATKALRRAISPSRESVPASTRHTILEMARILDRWKIVTVAACAATLVIGFQYLRIRVDLSQRMSAAQNRSVASFVLDPGLLRSARSKQLRLTVSDGDVLIQFMLHVELSERQDTYQAVLKAFDPEHEVLREGQLSAKPTGEYSTVVVEVPASLLRDGDYTLTLSAVNSITPEPIEIYSFGVVHSPTH